MIPQIRQYAETPGERIYAGRLSCESHGALVALINAGLAGMGELPVRLDEAPGEAYTLELGASGVYITGSAVNGLSTLLSLAKRDARGSYFSPCRIKDEPRFGYRGVMLDEVRHFQGEARVKKLLDMMFRLKLNVFHWHLSDDQGFRLALPDFPELAACTSRAYTTVGKERPTLPDRVPHGGFYTEAQVRDILVYAAERGIEVVPELDIPGHMSALLSAHPEYTCKGEPFPVPGVFGILENTLCAGNEEGVAFVMRLLDRLCALFSPKRFHIGSDEIRLDCLRTCPRCQTKMRELGLADEAALIGYVKNRFIEHLTARGVTPIQYNDGMSGYDARVLCHHWLEHSEKTTASWQNAGQRVIFSPCFWMYTGFPYAQTPLRKTWRISKTFSGMLAKEGVLGMELPMWTEYICSEGKLWFNLCYRMAVLSEEAWGAPRRSYGAFMQDLRGREQTLFGFTLGISEDILNPAPLKRFMRRRLYELVDTDIEYKAYLRQHEGDPRTHAPGKPFYAQSSFCPRDQSEGA